MKIMLIDDHAVVREGIRRLLALHFSPEISEAADVDEAMKVYGNVRPDIVLLDINLDGLGGFEFLRRIRPIDPEAKVLIFSMHAEPAYAARALRAGAKGFVSKSAPVDELIAAVRTVADGGEYIDKDIAARMPAGGTADDDPIARLSIREVEILRLLGQGKSLTAISEALGIAYKTVANICSQMKVKLGVERTADLIRLALENRQP